MIKWAGYGKLLKLSFFGLLISFFTLFVGSSVKADDSLFQIVGLESYPSVSDPQYEITFLKGGGLKTLYLGTARGVFAVRNDVIFWRDNEGLPYLYFDGGGNGVSQGNFHVASSCDSLTSGGNYVGPSNCSAFEINTGVGPQIFKNFFSKVNQGDVVYYSYYYGGNPYWWKQFHICFNSEEIGKSMCFDYCKNYNVDCSMPLVNSKGLSVSFATLSNNYIGFAPGQNGYLGVYEGTDGSSSSGSIDTTLTGNVLYEECTNGSVKTLVESRGMSPYMCYGGLPIDSNGLAVPVAGTGASVFEIYQNSSDGKSFKDWFDYWDNIYDNRYVYDSSIRSGTPAPLYSYFEFYNQYGPQWKAVYVENYCRIIVNDLPLTGKFTGISSWCSHSKPVYGIDDNSIVDGNIPIGTNWDGVGNISGNNQKSALVFIQDFFNLAKSKVPTNFNDIGGGFLPTYIIMFLLAIILFRFLMH